MTSEARTWGLPVVLAVVAVVLGGYLALGVEHPETYRRSAFNATALYAHIFGGSVMVIAGPFLLARRSRMGGFRIFHRWLGRAYLVGVLLASFGGLYVVRLVGEGGPLSRLAFACACLIWLLTGCLAYRLVRQRRFRDHGRWMVRNYAVTASFLTHGLWVVLLMAVFPRLGLEGEAGKAAGDWLAFSFNLLVAELFVIRKPLRGLSQRSCVTSVKKTPATDRGTA